MMVDMLIKGVSISKLPQQNNSSLKSASNKNFKDVLTEVKSASEPVIETSKNSTKPLNPTEKEMSNRKTTVEVKDENVVEGVELDDKLLPQIQLLLFQLAQESMNLEEQLQTIKEVAGLFAEINPDLLTGELLNLKQILQNDGMDFMLMEDILETIKEGLPVVLEELEILSERKIISTISATSEVSTDKSNKVEFKEEFQSIIKNNGIQEKPEADSEVLFEKIDLTPQSKDKNVETGDFRENRITSEDTEGDVSITKGEIPLNVNGAKFSQHLETNIQEVLPEIEAKALVQEVVNKVQILIQKGKSDMKIQLTPENLGTIHINISLEKGTLTAKMFAENQEIKEMIDANLNQLKIALGDKGLNISKLEVAVGHNQEDFNRSNHYSQQQRNKLKIKRLDKRDSAGFEATTYLEEGISSNPYIVNSKFNGLA